MKNLMRQRPGFYREVAALAFPMVVQNLIAQSLGLIDTLMVGPLGELSMAAVTLANIPIFVIQFLVFGLQSGGTVLIAQYWGKQDPDAINRVIGIGMYTGGLLSTAFALTALVCPEAFMGLFSNNEAVVAEAARYIRVVGMSYVCSSLTSVYIGAHRSMGNPRLGMWVMSVSLVVNPLLNWVFIYGHLGAPALGVVGAAIATLISRGVEFAVMLGHIAFSRRFRLRPSCMFRPGRVMLGKYLRYATPVVVNETFWGIGASLYPTIMGYMAESSTILAAYAIAGGMEKVCLVAANAVGAAAAILIGREIGAGKSGREEIYRMARSLDTVSFLVGLALGIGMAAASAAVINPILFPLFDLSQRAEEITWVMEMMIFAVLPLRSLNIGNTVGILRGGGDVVAASFIDILPVWLVSLPLMVLTGLVLQLDIA